MTQRNFPYTAWVLTPLCKPEQRTFVRVAYESRVHGTWDRSEGGKDYRLDDIYPSKDSAIAAGRARVDEQQKKIDKQQANINKRRAALDKAAAVPQEAGHG